MAEKADGARNDPPFSWFISVHSESRFGPCPLVYMVSWHVKVCKGLGVELRKVRKVAEGSENIDRRRWMRDESDACTFR